MKITLKSTLLATFLTAATLIFTACPNPTSPNGSETPGRKFHQLDTNQNGYVDIGLYPGDPNGEINPISSGSSKRMEKDGEIVDVIAYRFNANEFDNGVEYKISSETTSLNGLPRAYEFTGSGFDNKIFNLTAKNVRVEMWDSKNVKMDVAENPGIGYGYPVTRDLPMVTGGNGMNVTATGSGNVLVQAGENSYWVKPQ